MEMPKLLSSVVSFGDDAMLEILIRLPLKTVMRCRCLGKHWWSVMSDPYFMSQFYRHHLGMLKHNPHLQQQQQMKKNNMCKLFHERWEFGPRLYSVPQQKKTTTEFPLARLPFFNRLQQDDTKTRNTALAWVCGCSQGLLLCCDDMSLSNGTTYCICNPVTKDWIQLPPPFVNHKGKRNFDNDCTFGFLCESDSFMFRFWVVRIPIHADMQEVLEVEVFFSDTCRWMKLLVKCPGGFRFTGPLHYVSSNAVEYKGKLYFMGRNGILVFDPHSHADTDHTNDVVEYSCYILEYPERLGTKSDCLGTSCGSLVLAKCLYGYLRIWELKDCHTNKNDDHGNPTTTTTTIATNWCLVHQVLTDEFGWDNPFIRYIRFKVVAFCPHDRDVVLFLSGGLIDEKYRILFLYNLRTKKKEALEGRWSIQVEWDWITNFVLPQLPVQITYSNTHCQVQL